VARQRLGLLLAFLLLAGCAAAPTTTPTPPPRAVLVTSPALEPLVTGWLTSYADATGPLAFDLGVHAPSADLSGDETRIQGRPPGDMAFATPLGREAVAVIVNPDVNQRDFTFPELADLFAGRTEGWDAMGAGNGRVQPVIPLPGDCTRLVFEAAIMGPAPFASTALMASTPARMVAMVAETPGAIGLIPLSQPVDGVRLVRVGGQLPDPSRLDPADYPLTFQIVAAGQGPPADSIYGFLLWQQAKNATPSP
jgi:hypothetical protein